MAGYRERLWQPGFRDIGTRRPLPRSFYYRAFIPDPIAKLDIAFSLEVIASMLQAQQAVVDLQQRSAISGIDAVATPLLRAEGVGSSWIEGLRVSHRRLAEMIFDPQKRDELARSVVGNVRAMEEAVEISSHNRTFRVEDILDMNRTLLVATRDKRIAGQLREEQVWIGGRGASPADAEFVPPPEDEVPRLLEDLAAFVNRTELPPVAQAAIAHAQFEIIHPFADGNGRIGRCLIHVILKRRGSVTNFVPPVSVVLATSPKAYIGGLTGYRLGRIADWCAMFAGAVGAACRRASLLADSFLAAESRWHVQAGRPRKGSAASKILAGMPAHPILDVNAAMDIYGVSNSGARQALNALEEAAVMKNLSVSRYKRAWAATEVFDLLNRFEQELGIPEDPQESPDLRRRRAPRSA